MIPIEISMSKKSKEEIHEDVDFMNNVSDLCNKLNIPPETVPIQIAIAKGPILKHEDYDGQNGLYVAAAPDLASAERVLDLCNMLDIDLNPKKLHCTLMYSPEQAPSIEDAEFFTTNHGDVYGQINEIRSWIGHDKKTYIVAELVGESLQKAHQELLRLGAKHTYDPFTAHLTLDSQDEPLSVAQKRMIEKANLLLNKKPIDVKMYIRPPSNILE